MNFIRLIIIIISFLFIRNSIAQIGPVNFIDSTYATSGLSMFASADLDNDGDEEIIASFTGTSGKLAFFKNLSNGLFSGTLTIIDSIPFTMGLAVGDFNEDGWNDIVTIGGVNNEAWIYINNSGTFSNRDTLDSNISIFMNDVVVADFDGDNDDDIVIIGQHSIDLYRNNGAATFTKETILDTGSSTEPLECLDLATADMDSDGDMDLVCAETAGVVVYINSGDAIFTPNYYSVMAEVGFLIHPFDIDNDNDIDVLMNIGSGDVKWFSNDGSGALVFEEILTSVPDLLSMTSIDYNNDGYEDIYASYLHNISIFLNDSQHTFSSEVSVYTDNNLIMGPVHMANIDNLGHLDYVWSGANKSVAFHINQIETSISPNEIVNQIIYPNPTFDYVNVWSIEPIEDITIIDTYGRSLLKTKDNKINISKFPKGLYIINIKTKENNIIKEVIKY